MTPVAVAGVVVGAPCDSEEPLSAISTSAVAHELVRPEAVRVVIDGAGPPMLTPRLARALLRAMLNVERQRAAAQRSIGERQPPALAS